MGAYEHYLALVKAGALKAEVQLKEHQQKAVDLADKGTGSILLAHGVGTGKTITSLAIAERLKEHARAGKVLAVTPAALRGNYIQNGVHKFTDQKAVLLGPKNEQGSYHIEHPRLPNADYYVVSNEMFRKDPLRYIERTGADTVVVDEIHKARDPQSENYKALMTVRPMVKNLIGLTGTPVSNHPRDIVPLLDIVANRKHGLGASNQHDEFAGNARNHFDRKFMGRSTHVEGPLSFLGIGTKVTNPSFKNTHILRHELAKHVHYVSTKDVAKDMPEKKVRDIDVEMSGHQEKLYNFALSKVDPFTRWRIRNNLPVGTREAQHIFSMITQARQASNAIHPLDYKHTPATSAIETPKAHRVIKDVTEHLEAAPHHKAIIYTNLVTGGIDQMVAGLRAKGHEPGVFIGSQHQKRSEREAHVQDYLAGKKRVMVINTAGTEGLNLPGTTMHATLDPHFNPAVIEQAEARGIRAGSPVEAVQVNRYRSVMRRPFGIPFLPRDTGTDEWIYGIADRKEQLNNQFLHLMKSAAARALSPT